MSRFYNQDQQSTSSSYRPHHRHHRRHHLTSLRRGHASRSRSNSGRDDLNTSFPTATVASNPQIPSLYPSLDVPEAEPLASGSSAGASVPVVEQVPPPPPSTSSRDSRSSRRHHRRHQRAFVLKKCINNLASTGLNHIHDKIVQNLPPEMSAFYNNLQDSMAQTPERIHVATANSLRQQQHQNTADGNPRRQSAPDNDNGSEMHEFISSRSVQDFRDHSGPSVQQQPPVYNPYLPPPNSGRPRYMKSALSNTIYGIGYVGSALAPNLFNNVTNVVNKLPGSAQRIVNNLYDMGLDNDLSPSSPPPEYSDDRSSSRSSEDLTNVEPPPPLPTITPSVPQNRLEPLTLAELESSRTKMDIDAFRFRVFKGGISDDNDLRQRWWPIILKLHDSVSRADNQIDANYSFNWQECERMYEHYLNQWKSIYPDQEKRWSLYRERKSLIERDVIRCDRTHSFYTGDSNENLEKLRILLVTYLMYDFDTGYVQGMSDLASPMLYITGGDICKAFWYFVQTMDFTKDNFEMSQATIKMQLDYLFKLVKLTDPFFADYLANNESVNCYFAFRWIVCQFKREFMKNKQDGYQEILQLWESIWTCSSVRKCVKKPVPSQEEKTTASVSGDDAELANKMQRSLSIDNGLDVNMTAVASSSCDEDSIDNRQATKSSQPVDNELPQEISKSYHLVMNNLGQYVTVLQPDRLTDTQLYILCICLAIIRRERDLIMMRRFDATEILRHFNNLTLNDDLKDILIHAANIWTWLVVDGNEERLYAKEGGEPGQSGGQSSSPESNDGGATSPDVNDDYVLLDTSDLTPAINPSAPPSSESDDFVFKTT